MSELSYSAHDVGFFEHISQEGIIHVLMNGPRDWANIVRDRRVDLGLTQAELARRIGRARQWVVRFESGHAGSASLDSVIVLLNALDLYATVDAAEWNPDPAIAPVEGLSAESKARS